MSEVLASGPPDEGQYFKNKLEAALHFDPEIDSDDFKGYLDRTLDRLVALNEEILAASIRKAMPGVDPSRVKIKKEKQREWEDKAYKALGLPNLDEIIDRASRMLEMYNEAKDFIDRAEVELNFPAIPPG